MICILDRPCARVIKFLLMPVTMAIIPKPDPPEVTVSPDVFRSLAKPLTGWPKFQKYVNVFFCMVSSKSLSAIEANFREESICVMYTLLIAAVKLTFPTERKPVPALKEYFARYLSGEAG